MPNIYDHLLERSNDGYLLANVIYRQRSRHQTRKQIQATWPDGKPFHTWKDINTALACLGVGRDSLIRAIARNGKIKKYPQLKFSYVETDGVVGGRPVVGYYKGDLVYEWPSLTAAAETLGTTPTTVSSVCHGKRPRFKGVELFFVDRNPYAG